MTRDNQRLLIVMTYIAMFVLYMALLIFVVMPQLLNDPEAADVVMSLGLGTVLGWFMKQLGDMGQFYVRKGTTPKSENASDKPE